MSTKLQLNLNVRFNVETSDENVVAALHKLQIDGADLYLTEIEQDSYDARVSVESKDGSNVLTFTKTEKGDK